MDRTPRVVVVGAGLAGAACAAALQEAGVAVAVRDRARAPGGRMASPTLHDRATDLGAAYFTAKDDEFASVVRDWDTRGLAREWTDTFDVYDAEGHRRTSGPTRWATRDGLRSLVRDRLLGPGADALTLEAPVDDLAALDADAVVLAMPDPQARRLAPDAADWVEYEPVIAVAAGWDAKCWALPAAAFVNGDADLTLVADDGARRGDDAAVLVAHTTAERAHEHLDDPGAAVGPVLAALRRVLSVADEPLWTHAHRWTFAKPSATHGDAPYGLVEHDGRPLGLTTDSWCPEGAPRIESAYLSGRRLGRALAERLG